MNKLESKIIKAFRLAKRDINDLRNKVVSVSQGYYEAMRRLEDLENSKSRKPVSTNTKVIRVVTPKTTKSRSKTFVAAKEGKKFHIKECPYAQNIKPKSSVTFKSKDAALNKGYKPCKCIK